MTDAEREQLDAYFPPAGPCLFCGAADKRHRLWDTMAERCAAGETAAAVAEDYGYPVEAVLLAIRAVRKG